MELTLFDRYSSRFGGRTEQPGLLAERATNYEIGWSERLFGNLKVASAIFYSDIQDSINSSFAAPNGNGSIVVYQADGESYGFEFSADWGVTRTLRIGGNYGYLERDLDFANARIDGPTTAQRAAVTASQLEGTPRHKAFLYAAWSPMNQLTLTPSLELASDRNALVTSCASTLVVPPAGTQENAHGLCNKPSSPRLPNYTQFGAYALVNFQAEYAFSPGTSLNLGVTNLLDQDYTLSEGFPEPGRMFFASMRARF